MDQQELTENEKYKKKFLNNARFSLMFLAFYYVFSGALTLFVQSVTYDRVLASISEYKDSELVKAKDGQMLNVGDLRWSIILKKYGSFGGYMLLAGLMLGLWAWSKKSPFPAVVIAGLIYVPLYASELIMDPTSIMRGSFIKFAVLLIFFSGIISAHAYSKLEKSPRSTEEPRA